MAFSDAYRLQRYIGRHILEQGNRTAFCCVRAGWGKSTVSVSVSAGSSACSIHGVAYCSSVWVCPVCSSIIRAKRSTLTTDVFTRTMAAGYRLLFVTLTLHHVTATPLVDVLAIQRQAWRHMSQSRLYRDWVKSTGSRWSMRALEVTHGGSGWHPHFHVVYAVAEGYTPDLDMLYTVWAGSVVSAGGYASPLAYHAVYIADPAEVATYTASWGGGDFKIGYEVSSDKKGRRGSRSPFQLAADGMGGDVGSDVLFREYAHGIKGLRAQTWSRAWRAAFAVPADDLVVDENDLTSIDGAVVVVLAAYEYEKLKKYRDDFIEAIVCRNLSELYAVCDMLEITLDLVNLPYFFGESGRLSDTVTYGGGYASTWATADHARLCAVHTGL